MNGWQPIETAPREKRVLVCFAGGTPFTARLDDVYGTWWHTPGDSPVREHNLPTHWMPLPPPPEEKP